MDTKPLSVASQKRAPKKKILQYPEEAVEAAVKSLKERKNQLSVRQAARLHGVPYGTLRNRFRGTPSIRKMERTALSTDQERRIVSWLKESTQRGFGKTKTQILRYVQDFVKDTEQALPFKNGKPGYKWLRGFLKRRRKELGLRTSQALESKHAAVTESKIRDWLKTAYDEITAVDSDVLNHPQRIFSCDEAGFLLAGVIVRVKPGKGDKVTHDTHKRVSVLACGSASGEVHHPLIIYPGKRLHFDPLAGFPQAHFSKSVNGWIDSEIFLSWLQSAFIPAVTDLKKPIVLFVDGHISPLSHGVSELCRDYSIILYQLPRNSSYVIQPLDLTTFQNLKEVWKDEVMKYQEESSDILGKKDFSHVLKKAWERGIQKDAVISGFRAAHIFPWGPDHVDTTKLGSPPEGSHLTSTDVVPRETSAQTGTVTVTPNSPSGHPPRESAVQVWTVTGAPDLPSNPPPLALPHLPPFTVKVQGSSTDTSFCAQDTLAPSTSSRANDISPLIALDRLLDVVARAGLDRLSHFRIMHTLNRGTDDPDQHLFTLLYDRLVNILKD